MIIKWFLSASVTGDEELPLVGVINAKGKHAIHPTEQALNAPFFITMHQRLRVAVGGKNVTLVFEFVTKLDVVVSLPIVTDGDGTILVEDRLPARPQVDDAQSPHPHLEGHTLRRFKISLTVGATMTDDPSHSLEKLVFVKSRKSVYSAHISFNVTRGSDSVHHLQ